MTVLDTQKAYHIMVSIVDVYDALRSERPYKKELEHKETVKIMNKEKSSHFDPVIFSIFMKHNEEFNKVYNKLIKA